MAVPTPETRAKTDLAVGKHSLSMKGISADQNGWRVRVSCEDWTPGPVGLVRVQMIYPDRTVTVSATVSGGGFGPDGLPARTCSLSGSWPMEVFKDAGGEFARETKPAEITLDFEPSRPVRSSLQLEALEGQGAAPFKIHHSIAFVRSTGKVTGENVDSINLSFGALPAAGNFIVASGASWQTSGANFPAGGVTDNQSNTYTLALQGNQPGNPAGGNNRVALYYVTNIGSPSGTFTVTVNPDSTGNYMGACAAEYSGVLTTSPLIDSGQNSQTGTTPSASTAGSAAAVGDLVIGCVTVGGASSDAGIDTPSGYTNLAVHQDVNAIIGFSMDWKLASGSGTQSVAHGTLNGSDRTSTIIAVFGAAPGGGGGGSANAGRCALLGVGT